MSSNGRTAMLGTAFSICALAFGVARAPAATVLPPPDSAWAGETILEVSVIEMKKKQDPTTIWNRVHDGDRCLYRVGSCRHFYRGYYYETPWWGLPLANAGVIGASDFGHVKPAAMS